MRYNLNLIPAYGRAYGRAYGSKEEILADWESGKDFKIAGGPYCSIRDFKEMKLEADKIQLTWGLYGMYSHTLYDFWGGQLK